MPDAALLEVEAVVVRFGGVTALDGISFSLGSGALRCILGPNGCGKTTLFNALTGALRPSRGRVRLRGRDILGLSPQAIARLGVSRKFQVPGIYSELSVAENLEAAMVGGGTGLRALLSRRAQPGKLRELLGFAGLQRKAALAAGQLAHGEKQRLEIAMLLASEAELLLLDEPTAGMSKGETEAIAELVRSLCAERGKTVLVIEHDMNFVRKLDCPVMVMARGVVIAQGSFEQVRGDPRVIESYLGRAA